MIWQRISNPRWTAINLTVLTPKIEFSHAALDGFQIREYRSYPLVRADETVFADTELVSPYGGECISEVKTVTEDWLTRKAYCNERYIRPVARRNIFFSGKFPTSSSRNPENGEVKKFEGGPEHIERPPARRA
jgi:hypothetical protein